MGDNESIYLTHAVVIQYVHLIISIKLLITEAMQ